MTLIDPIIDRRVGPSVGLSVAARVGVGRTVELLCSIDAKGTSMSDDSNRLLQQRTGPEGEGQKPPYLQSAITSLICGVAGLVFGFLPGFGMLPGAAAVILGHFALRKFRTLDGPRSGKGMAIAGLVLGYVDVVVGFVFAAMIAGAGLSAAGA